MPGWKEDRDNLKDRPRSQGSSRSFGSHGDCRFPWEQTASAALDDISSPPSLAAGNT